MAVEKVTGPDVPEEAGALFVAATPIGNLNDISTRLGSVLKRVFARRGRGYAACRQATAKRGRSPHLNIAYTPTMSGRGFRSCCGHCWPAPTWCCCCDAGTPGISDPGMRLVWDARQAGIRVIPLPGPCAAVAALSVAGFPADRFRFEGFLPARSAARRARLEELKAVPETLVFFEAVSPAGSGA